MNHPHVVKKAVPFILMDTSGWDPYYYATMLVREDFKKQGPFAISPLVYFYEYFKGVDGDIAHSWCDSGDIQHIAYNNDGEIILLYHNVSNKSGEISINLNELKDKVKGAKIRRVGRYEDNRKPYLSEKKMKDLSKFIIAPRESVAIFISINGDGDSTRSLEEVAHYATEQSIQFKGSHNFTLNDDDANRVEESF